VIRTAKNPLDSLTKFSTHQKRATLLIVGLVMIVLFLFMTIPAILDVVTHRVSLPSIGTINTIGVKAYYDPNLQNVTNQIHWGTTQPGATANVTLCIESTSNTKTALHLETANWALLNSQNAIVFGPNQTTSYLSLTWNYNGTTVNPGQIIPVTLTRYITDAPTFAHLLITNNITGFSFDMTISAQQTN
jgi:hypothetical protein